MHVYAHAYAPAATTNKRNTHNTHTHTHTHTTRTRPTGLDSATLFAIVRHLGAVCRSFKTTYVVSLLQVRPTPSALSSPRPRPLRAC